ncbi:MAG TPA: neutral/alkaline non-lysosomal ceramidase N-terminal domain-containing protein [Planctomycetota bacterium]|nr:neutral/alkaline non-lysosomal ceramidase N-terminal domain-containing protein [Planctomycetota bacterium]
MKRIGLLLLLLGCSSAPPAPEPAFWAGAAVVDITPGRPVPLGGYGARKGAPLTGVHDPIYAKALWLETKDARVCLVTTDLIGSTLEMRDAIKPPDAELVMAGSHTHSGPGALAKGVWIFAMGNYDAAFRDEMTAQLKKVVEEARARKRPARIAFARDLEPTLCRNRRHDGGPTDPEVNVLLVEDTLARPIAVVTNYTAHGTVLSDKNFLVSGDWPGAFQRALESRLPAVALYTNGAEGDIAPRAPGGRDPFERCHAIGDALAGRVANLVGALEKTTGQVTLGYVERGVELPTPTLPLVPRKSVLGMLEINGVRMFCFPGEPCVELGLELKRSFPGSWILGLANDHLGYFLTEEEYQKGGYEKGVSFYGPKMGPWLVRRFTELGERGHAQDRPGQPEGGRGKDHDGR